MKTRRQQVYHASLGIGKPYPHEVRDQIVWRHVNGIPQTNAMIRQLQAAKQYPSSRTITRYIRQYLTVGHVLPYSRTGNRRVQREVIGADLISLAILRSIRPKAMICEVKAFIHSTNPANDVYSDSQICRAETRLGLTRKKGSTTAFHYVRGGHTKTIVATTAISYCRCFMCT